MVNGSALGADGRRLAEVQFATAVRAERSRFALARGQELGIRFAHQSHLKSLTAASCPFLREIASLRRFPLRRTVTSAENKRTKAQAPSIP